MAWRSQRQRAEQCRGIEGPEQADLEHADLVSLGKQMFDRLMRRLGAGTHDDDDPFGVCRTHIVEEPIGAPGQRGEAVHGILDNGRKGVVNRGWLAPVPGRTHPGSGTCRAAPDAPATGRGRGVRPPGRRRSWRAPCHCSTASILATSCEVRKAVEEVDHRQAPGQGGGLGDQGHVLGLLNRVAASMAQPVARQAITSE
jgi:hypothetical protein